MLTLLQTGKRDLVPVVFLDAPGGDFWRPFQNFVQERLLARGMISPEDTSLYILTDSAFQPMIRQRMEAILGAAR